MGSLFTGEKEDERESDIEGLRRFYKNVDIEIEEGFVVEKVSM